MDPALLRERELFLKRAKATPSVEKRKLKPDDANDKKAKKPKVRAAPPKPASKINLYIFFCYCTNFIFTLGCIQCSPLNLLNLNNRL